MVFSTINHPSMGVTPIDGNPHLGPFSHTTTSSHMHCGQVPPLGGHSTKINYWLVVYLPLCKIWKSLGMLIPTYSQYMDKYNMFQTTNRISDTWVIFMMKWSCFHVDAMNELQRPSMTTLCQFSWPSGTELFAETPWETDDFQQGMFYFIFFSG